MAAVMCTVIYEFDVLELDEVEWDSNEYDDIIEDVKANWEDYRDAGNYTSWCELVEES